MKLESDMRALYETFFDLESRHDVFNGKIEGVHFWKRCRETVFWHAASVRAPWAQDRKPSLGYRLPRKVILLGRSLLDYAFGCRPSDVLILASSRRVFDPSTRKWRDIYTDPLVKHLASASVFQEPSGVDTRRLSKPFPVKYLDYVSLLSRAAQGLTKLRRWTPSDSAYLKQLDAVFVDAFGVDCRVAEHARRAACKARAQIPLFRGLIRRVRPRLAVIVNSHGKEDFIEACHAEGVIVAELQHGMIMPYHLGYSLPACESVRKVFPDYLLLFGEVWKEAVRFPLDKRNLLVTGYPFLDQERARLSVNCRSGRRVVFLSQPTIGSDLSRMALQTAELLGDEWEVIYRLHPSERGGWEDLFPWLVRSRVKVQQAGTSPYELLAGSKWHVGVSSTTVFEGIGLGSTGIVVDLPGAEQMTWLVENGYAVLARSAEEVAEAVRSNTEVRRTDVDYLFAPDAERKLVDTVQELLWRHSW